MRKLSGQTLFLLSVVVASCLLVGYLAYESRSSAGPPIASRLTQRDIPFDGQQAYEYLKRLCDIGPRPSGSAGMRAQQELIVDHFEKLGAKVTLQSFQVRHPQDGSAVTMSNILVSWHPERRERILLCAHYDTRPFPDRDPRSPRGTFVGANDGASGVAVLMELGNDVARLKGSRGLDFVLFDGEEFVFDDKDPYFLGSDYFARAYVAERPDYKYRWAVLLDMVGDADLQIYQERNSASWSDTQPLVAAIWRTANRLGVNEFVPKKKHEIRDDHLKLHNIAHIPACDIIDFDYPHWHTERDTAENCSPLSLAKVGWVLEEWLKTAMTER